MIVFNQKKFLAKEHYWFRVLCETLGWKLSIAFCDYLFMVLFVICANPSDVKKITQKISQNIKGTWGNSAVQKVVKKNFKEAAKKAERENKIKFKETFKLLKNIFPNALK